MHVKEKKDATGSTRRWWGCVISAGAGLLLAVYACYNASRQPAPWSRRLGRTTHSIHETEPYRNFVNPDNTLLRMFYSGRLAQPSTQNKTGPETPLKAHVTRFQARAVTPNTRCVPFHAPANKTLKICIYEERVDGLVSGALAARGVWEEELVREVAAALGRAGEEGPVTLVDAGCHVGVYTLAAASLGHWVLAVDPVRSSLQLLHASLTLNSLQQNVTLLHNALAHRRAPVSVQPGAGNMGGSSVSLQTGRGVEGSVWGVCLDDVLPLVSTRRVVLKLDVEGWEDRVLRCAALFFQTRDVRAVLMEWLFHRTSRSASPIITFLTRNGLLPYSTLQPPTLLSLQHPHTWPDNVFWRKR